MAAGDFAVLGGGNGGVAMAAHLALLGRAVTLWNRTAARLEPIRARGGIELESFPGGPAGLAKLRRVTDSLRRALADADTLMVVLPSSAHREVAQGCAPHLRDGHVVVLHPGRTGGAMEFVKVLKDSGCTADVVVAEAGTFIYASRAAEATARIFSVKESVPLAALPASRTGEALARLADVYPQFTDGENVLKTGLDNMGAIFHPALTILNAGWIEFAKGGFEFYHDGVTPGTARVLEVLDRERVTIAAAVGVRARTAAEWLRGSYDVGGDDIHALIHANQGYAGIAAPGTLDHRYIFEDVPMSLVPMAALGTRYGVSTRGMEALILLASILHRTDYRRRGRTLDTLGIQSLSVSELARYVNEGVLPADTGGG